MENATKALIIAASVLIVMLLIGLGIKIFDTTSQPTETLEGNMQSTDIQMFNNKFYQYSGTQSGSKVKALASTVASHNATSSRQVSFMTLTTPSDIMNAVAGIDNMASYTVTVTPGADGYVSTITFV